MSEMQGGCLCGAVRFTARDVPGKVGVCHCRMCQRWTGAALFEVSLPQGNVDWQGESIATFASSEIAERAFCSVCGSGLWFRVTEAGAWAGTYDIPLGLFDDPDAFDLSHEIFVDKAAKAVALADRGQARLTRAECVAKFDRLGDVPPV